MSSQTWRQRAATERRRGQPALRVPGHKLTLEWSGERGEESSSTAVCSCGWEESASSQARCRQEYRQHLLRVLAQAGEVEKLQRLKDAGWSVDRQLANAKEKR